MMEESSFVSVEVAETSFEDSICNETENDGKRDGGQCCQRYNPRENPVEFILLMAVFVIFVGIVVMCVGYLVPRGFRFDPSLSAREMEQVEQRFADLSFHLDVCVVTGMTFIAMGSVTVSILFTCALFCPKEKIYRRAERDDLNLLHGSTAMQVTSYGSRASRDTDK